MTTVFVEQPQALPGSAIDCMTRQNLCKLVLAQDRGQTMNCMPP